jgi:hypothetical protein
MVKSLSAALLSLIPIGSVSGDTVAQQHPLNASPDLARVPVPVILGVMSNCPDARYCEDVFNDVLHKVGHEIVDIQLSFIGKPNSTHSHYGVDCLHGPLECAANVQELCAAKYSSGSEEWWPFVQCINQQDRSVVGKQEVAKACASEVGLEWEWSGMSACSRSIEGQRMLFESVKATKALNVTKSCTIIINNKIRCVRDGEWKECEHGHSVSDFVNQIRREYEKLNDLAIGSLST